jgi:uncharacterized protein DUF4190
MTYQQQGGYPGAPGGYPDPAARQGNGLAVAGMVCGIVGLLIAGIILGPLAIIFGGIGLSRANKGAPHRGQAIAGLVLGILDVVLIVILIAAASHNGGSYFYFHTN